jgi:hypothetical protein
MKGGVEDAFSAVRNACQIPTDFTRRDVHDISHDALFSCTLNIRYCLEARVILNSGMLSNTDFHYSIQFTLA